MHSPVKAFIGAAVVPDIIHHAFRGDSSRLFGANSSTPFRYSLSPFFYFNHF
jgi:hypothetical protein